MKFKKLNLCTCLNLVSLMILLVGLGSAILIYRTAEDTPYGVLGYEEGGEPTPSCHPAWNLTVKTIGT